MMLTLALLLSTITVKAFASVDPLTATVITILRSLGFTIATDSDTQKRIANDFYSWLDNMRKYPETIPIAGNLIGAWECIYGVSDMITSSDAYKNGVNCIINWTGEQWNAIRQSVFGWYEQNKNITFKDIHLQSSNGIIGWESDNAFDITLTDLDLNAGIVSIPTPKNGPIKYHTMNDMYFLDYPVFKLNYDTNVTNDVDNHYFKSEWIEVDLGNGLYYYNVLYPNTSIKQLLRDGTWFSGYSKAQFGHYYLYSVPGNIQVDLFNTFNYRTEKTSNLSYNNMSTPVCFFVKNGRYLQLKEKSGETQKLVYVDTGEVAIDLGTSRSGNYNLNDYIMQCLGYALPKSQGKEDDDYTPTVSIPTSGSLDFGKSVGIDNVPEKSKDEVTGKDVYAGDVSNDASVSVSIPTTKYKLDELVNDDTIADTAVDTNTYPDGVPKIDSSGLFDKFPFCLPYDLYNVFAGFYTDNAVAPRFEFPFRYLKDDNGNYLINENIVIDFAVLDDVVPILRFFISLGFVVVLIQITRKMIGA